eukprot:1189238-Prorocentrum_minimum.AAC.1
MPQVRSNHRRQESIYPKWGPITGGRRAYTPTSGLNITADGVWIAPACDLVGYSPPYTVRLTVKTLSSHLITREFNSPTKSLRTL